MYIFSPKNSYYNYYTPAVLYFQYYLSSPLNYNYFFIFFEKTLAFLKSM